MTRRRAKVVFGLVALSCVAGRLIAEQSWTALGPPHWSTTVVVDHVAESPNPVIYTGTQESGVYRSENGIAWTAVNHGLSNLAINELAVAEDPMAPGGPSLLYAGTEDGLFKSVDRGANWVKIDGLPGRSISTIAVAASGAIFVSAGGHPARSDDGGRSWAWLHVPPTSSLAGRDVVSLAVDPASATTIYAAGGDLLVSHDSGETWKSLALPVAIYAPRLVTVDPFHSSTIFVGVESFGGVPVIFGALRSPDGGRTWSGIGRFDQAFGSFAFPDASTVFGSLFLGGNVARSLDGGVTFQPAGLGLEGRRVGRVIADRSVTGNVIYGATDSGIYRLDLGSSAPSCGSEAVNLCLNGGRFRVQVAWTASNIGRSGAGQAMPLTSDSGAFWFFQPSNIELVVKVLDGRAINGHFWVFYGALSNVGYTITVTDTATGESKTYTNPEGQLGSLADTEAF